MVKLDYKKEYKDLYMPKGIPTFIDVPPIAYVMVEGKGNPNTSKEYQAAVGILYAISYAIKMSKMGKNQPVGYFDYVVPPLGEMMNILMVNVLLIKISFIGSQ